MSRPNRPTLQGKLAEGPIILGEGFVFELEHRGHVKAGPFVPEVILEDPEALRQLHREFLHAGSDVVLACTYYADEAKLATVGRGGQLEEFNRTAVRIANEVAAEDPNVLVAGNICNTWDYDPDDIEKSSAKVRDTYEKQVGWAIDEGVDFILSETHDFVGEALIAIEVCNQLNIPVMVNLMTLLEGATRDGYKHTEAIRMPADKGAAVAGLNCGRGPNTMMPILRDLREAISTPLAAVPVPFRTTPDFPVFEALENNGQSAFPLALEPHLCTRFEMADFAREANEIGIEVIGVCCGGAPYHVRSMAEALGRTPVASKNSPAMELHPVLGKETAKHFEKFYG